MIVKSLNLEKSTFDCLLQLGDYSYGILIGQVTESTVHIFLPIAAPVKTESEGEESSHEEINTDSKKIVTDPISFSDVDENWLGNHAQNVLRMLPGAISVLGFYSMGNASIISDCESKIRKVLHNIYKKESNFTSDLLGKPDHLKYALVIDREKSCFHAREIDVLNSSAALRTVDVKLKNFSNSFHIIYSNILIAMNTTLPAERKKEKILKVLQNAMEPFIKEFILQSKMLINGSLKEPLTKLFPDDWIPPAIPPMSSAMHHQRSSSWNIRRSSRSLLFGALVGGDNAADDAASNASSSDSNSAGPGHLNLMFIGHELPEYRRLPYESDEDSGFEMINRVRIQGRIPGLAFVHRDVTSGDAAKYLKEDLTRTIFSRLELLTDELHITGGVLDVSRVLLPQRVRVSLPSCPRLPLSDYKFFSETAEDVVGRVRYLLQVPGSRINIHSKTDNEGVHRNRELDENCVDIIGLESAEQTSLEDEMSNADSLEEPDYSSISNKSQLVPMYIGISLLVLFVSAFLYWMYRD